MIRPWAARFSLGLVVAGFVFSVLFSSTLTASKAYAENECPVGVATYSGATHLDQDTYDVYVKLPTADLLTAEVTIFTSTKDSDCQTIGTAVASGEVWQKVGTLAVDAPQTYTQLNVSSDGLDASQATDQPAVMLVSQTQPACQPTTDCFVTISDKRATLQLTDSGPIAGTLPLYTPKNIDSQPIEKVEYYVDGRLMYKTDDLQEFDPKSIAFNSVSASRLITFTNGQVASIEQPVPTAYNDSFAALLMRTARQYQPILIWSAVIAGIAIVYFIFRAIMHSYSTRQQWKYAHGLMEGKSIKPAKANLATRLYMMSHMQRIIGGLGILAVVAVVGLVLYSLVDSYIIQSTTVRGVAMENSLENGKRVIIDKTGVTFSAINQSRFIPKRGQVVALYLDLQSNQQKGTASGNLVIRRVIGLPGDQVIMAGDSVRIYNADHPDGFDPTEGLDWEKNIISDNANTQVDVTLKTDEIFILGDNRPGSIDSRQVGPLSVQNIIGVIR